MKTRNVRLRQWIRYMYYLDALPTRQRTRMVRAWIRFNDPGYFTRDRKRAKRHKDQP